MSSPQPPVALKNPCSIVHDGVLYVYTPDAFQTLELKEGAKWEELSKGVSVTDGVCVKGGVDGDNSRPALYVVGGIANDAPSDYSGLQRYSINDKSWKNIPLTAPVTQHRHNHGAAYMVASSSIVVYSGAQDEYDGASSETFVLQTYPPYDVQAYSSTAPPTIRPFMLPWNEERALLVGGGDTNTNIFTFGPTQGWQDLGLSLPMALPDSSIAQSALFTLADNSKILQTFNLESSPPTVFTNVLLNPGGQPATFNETVGNAEQPPSDTSSVSQKMKRATFLNTFPTYNSTYAPSTTRSGFSIAQGDDGLIAFVGGNDDAPVAFFNQSENSWINNARLLGEQAPLTTASSTGSRTSSIPTPTASSIPTTSAAPAASSSSKSHGLTILGAVLGGICGLAAILIILLLWLRSVRRKRAQAERQSEYPDDKRRSGDYNFEERGLQPLSKAGQPMGRSPVPSTMISDADSTAMFGPKPDPKYLIRRVSTDRNQPGFRGSGIAFGQALFKREKSAQLSISKPMNPVLGDYKERPSIDLGAATPGAAAAVSAPRLAAATAPARKPSQRKTDEGWGKYFQKEAPSGNRTTFLSRSSASKSGFWPGAGVPENQNQLRPPKILLRDSIGNPLEAHSVAAGSPSLEHGPSNPQSRGLQAAQGIPARISSASSITTDSTDDDYEDDRIDGAFSSGVPASVNNLSWTPVGNTWSGPAERPLRPPSSYVAVHGQPLNTASSNETNGTSETKSSSIPSFPMPNSIRTGQATGANTTTGSSNLRPTVHSPNITGDYFGNFGDHNDVPQANNSDMSWLNLGTPNPNR